MRSRSIKKFTYVVCLLVLFPMNPAWVQAQTLEKLPVAYTVIAPTQATLWTAKELGLFAKHGLDVELVLLVSAPLAVTALVSGETPIVHAGASAVVTSNLQGSGAVLVAGGANRFPYVLFVTDEIKRWKT
jgi:ABC-type nitrate/sulfonate/bicarbonate transport system substrate-binding protein